MHFTAQPDGFAAAVSAALASLPARPQPPILGAIMIETGDDAVAFSTYTWDHSTTAHAAATITKPGRVAVSGRLLSTIAARLPKRELTAQVVGNRLQISSGKTEFTLPMMDVDEYPTIPVADEIVGIVDADAFISAVRGVARTAQKEDAARTALGAIELSTDGDELTITAVNRKRMATVEMPWIASSKPLDALVHAADLASICKALEGSTELEIRTSASGGLVTLVGVQGRSTLSTFDDRFPNWPDLFPSEVATIARVGGEFFAALERVAALATDSYFAEIALVDDVATLRIEGTITDECEIELLGAGIEFAVNPSNLIDGIAAVGSDEISLTFVDHRMTAIYDGTHEVALDQALPTAGRRAIVMGGQE